MQQQDSYADFAPTRQSSLLTDQTLPMNGTDVYADVSVVWPALHKARELQLERARNQYALRINSVLQDTLPNEPTNSNITECEDTVWMTALDISFSPEDCIDDANNQSIYHTVLDYLNEKTPTKGKMIKIPRRLCFNETSPMDDELLNDTLPMDDDTLNDTLSMNDEPLKDKLPMDDHTLNDTLPMSDDELLNDTLSMDDDTLNDTLPMDDNDNGC